MALGVENQAAISATNTFISAPGPLPGPRHSHLCHSGHQELVSSSFRISLNLDILMVSLTSTQNHMMDIDGYCPPTSLC